MISLPEYVGTVHIIFGPYRGNPIALYLRKDTDQYRIAPQTYPWNRIVGEGDNPNRAAADFETKWKAGGLSADMYTGPHWEGGIKPEKPAAAKGGAGAKTQPSAGVKAPPSTAEDEPKAPPANQAASASSEENQPAAKPQEDSPEPS